MASGQRIAVVGATGAVGQTTLKILEQRKFPIRELRAYASARSAGTTVTFAGDQVKVEFPLELPFLRFRTIDGLPTMIAAFTTDIPKLTNWGEPLLIGPGSIHVAHTDGEFIEKKQLAEAIDLYCAIAKKL